MPSTWPAALQAAASARGYQAGACVFRRAQPVQAVYQVRAGRIALRRDEADGTSLTLQTANPGDFLAEASLFATSYHCDAVCLQDTQVLMLPASTVLACLQSDASFALDWVRLLSTQLMRSRAREERLILRTPRQRVLHCLRLESDAQRRFTAPGTLMQWAHGLGLAHETLYRTLAQLEQEGLIARDGTTIRLV
ncbi:Crp/Fnr family transcriptional regulator [Pandoraea sp.]|uniref:Crp/Fnr family transcriptional regulator n=1 Tax=Pandoraea sp. TaxID=1883445 RepID=UPI0025CDA5A2|nr:Crp/Fnr family transcriptional regulator [Pandoraea sp.]